MSLDLRPDDASQRALVDARPESRVVFDQEVERHRHGCWLRRDAREDQPLKCAPTGSVYRGVAGEVKRVLDCTVAIRLGCDLERPAEEGDSVVGDHCWRLVADWESLQLAYPVGLQRERQ